MADTINNDIRDILCCNCGDPTPPSECNMCIACIRSKVDITGGIPSQAIIHFCRGCSRFLLPPNQWIACELESQELLAICLKRLKGLNNVTLIDASFIWTAPTSRRIKMKLVIQKSVLGGTLINQILEVEYTVHNETCEACHRLAAKDTWNAVVQLRQKVSHKKTMYYLEQVISKYNAQSKVINLKSYDNGMDYYFSKRDHAIKLTNFFQSMIVSRIKMGQKLISADIHSNTQNYKFTYSVEIATVCKGDIVCLPLKLARSLGHISQLAVCLHVSNIFRFIDPMTARVAELNGDRYWGNHFNSFATPNDMKHFMVIDCELIAYTDSSQGRASQQHAMADVWLQPLDVVGAADQIHTRTHLGGLLHPGDTVLGLDLRTCNINDPNFQKLKGEKIPDVILVKKVYLNRKERMRRRQWNLKTLNDDLPREENDMQELMEDLEEDALLRKHVNIFRDHTKEPIVEEATEDYPVISLEEMMEDLTIEDEPME